MPAPHGAAGKHPQAVKGEEEEGCNLGKGMSCWEAREESLKFRIRKTGGILLLARGSAGMHKGGAEAATRYGCPFLSTHCSHPSPAAP